MSTTAPKYEVVTPYTLAVADAMKSASTLAKFNLRQLECSIAVTPGEAFLTARRPGRGGLCLRLGTPAMEAAVAVKRSRVDNSLRVSVSSELGVQVTTISTGTLGLDFLRATTEFTPKVDMFIPYTPRDLYVFDNEDKPSGAEGCIRATQRGINSGLVYFDFKEPAFGSVLYFQNWTSLNDYFNATGTTPIDAVGGVWPEMGMLLPPSSDPKQALPAGKKVCVSDAIIVIRESGAEHERESARQFLQLLGMAYKQLDPPGTEYRDWVSRASQTLADLDKAPEATIKHYGHRYAHPYTGAEYPDIMVQMTLLQAIFEWGKWAGTVHPLEEEFRAGLSRFYDPKLRTLRRYLPNVGDDKNADAVDSWYLYHPLLNLGRMALAGDEVAERLFKQSLDYGIKSARHFKYKWPVQYDVTNFSVITDVAGADGRGQTDVGGIYAWVMLQAFELTDDKQYLDEARAAIDAAVGLRFDINYQANLTAWGAAACMRLWRITNQPVYLEQSYVYLGSFFHNCEIWKSEIALAKHYDNFLGVTCLQDAPYMAIYECFDSFSAFEEYLNDSGPDTEPAARMLISEYCRYALSRAWYYYPDALPAEVIAPKQREHNGHVDRTLSFPLEDLYADGQQAGQVGQEIYGAGAALIFASRSTHIVKGAPFTIYCDQFLRAKERTSEATLTLTLDGGESCKARLCLVRLPRRKLGELSVATIDGDKIRPSLETAERIEFTVPASGRLIVGWKS